MKLMLTYLVVYKKRYDNLLFVVYDSGGFITNQRKFREDVESTTPLVKILITQPIAPTYSVKKDKQKSQRDSHPKKE